VEDYALISTLLKYGVDNEGQIAVSVTEISNYKG
jgi:hypothetical protein